MGEDEIRELMSPAMLSPTAFNIQHWRFVQVRDPALREEIRAACWMQPQITDASLLVVICADVKAWPKSPERYWRRRAWAMTSAPWNWATWTPWPGSSTLPRGGQLAYEEVVRTDRF